MIDLTRKTVNTLLALTISHNLLIPSLKIVNIICEAGNQNPTEENIKGG